MGAGTSLEDVLIDVELGQRDRRHAVLADRSDQLVLVEEAQADEDRADFFRASLSAPRGFLSCSAVEQTVGDEEVAETPIHTLPELPLLGHCNFLLYPTQALQRIGKGPVRVVLIDQRKSHALRPVGPALRWATSAWSHGVGRGGRRHVADRFERGQRQRRDAMLGGQRQDARVVAAICGPSVVRSGPMTAAWITCVAPGCRRWSARLADFHRTLPPPLPR